MKKNNLTKPQLAMKKRFDNGEKIYEVRVSKNDYEYRWTGDDSLARYRTFWNLMRVLKEDQPSNYITNYENIKQPS